MCTLDSPCGGQLRERRHYDGYTDVTTRECVGGGHTLGYVGAAPPALRSRPVGLPGRVAKTATRKCRACRREFQGTRMRRYCGRVGCTRTTEKACAYTKCGKVFRPKLGHERNIYCSRQCGFAQTATERKTGLGSWVKPVPVPYAGRR